MTHRADKRRTRIASLPQLQQRHLSTCPAPLPNLVPAPAPVPAPASAAAARAEQLRDAEPIKSCHDNLLLSCLLPALSSSHSLPLPIVCHIASHHITRRLRFPACLPACPALTGLQASLRFLISNSIRLRTQLRLLLSFASHALTPFCATVIGITVSNNYNVNVQQGA